MSWLFGSLQPDDDPHDADESPTSSPQNDMSLLGQTIGRQLRGVASFLAPPPSSQDDAVPSSNSRPQSSPQSQSQALLGIRNDLAEIGGSFRSGLSLFSTNSNKAVTEISKFASNLLQLQNEAIEDDVDNDGGSAPGISDELLGFVSEISGMPDYWTDFPIAVDQDFRMSGAQREHASAVERLVPGFRDLRVGLCSSMREEQFWMIYFMLLLPRLNEQDFELLSTPKIVEARDALLQKLQNKRKTLVDNSEKSSLKSSQKDIQVGETQGEDIVSQEKEALTGIVNTAERLKMDDEESTEQWSEEASISSGTFVDGPKKDEPEEDISFSDLEDDENDLSSRVSGLRRAHAQDGRAYGSNDWVQLNRSSDVEVGQQKAGQSKEKDSEGEESNDWLTVDEFD